MVGVCGRSGSFNVLLDVGRIAAIGTHEELSAGSALYRSLLAEALKPSVEPRPTPPLNLSPAPQSGPAGSPPG